MLTAWPPIRRSDLTRKPPGSSAVRGTRMSSSAEVLGQLPDPIDLQRDQEILARYGLDQERLMEVMGGSP